METFQQEQKEEIITWLKDTALKKITDNLKIPLKNITYKLYPPENCHFLSSVWYLDLNYNDGNECIHDDNNVKKNNSVHLVIKKPGFPTMLDEMVHTTELFHNEILFFDKIARSNSDFPRCLLTVEDKHNNQNTVIVMENICPQGYQMCPQSYDIPFEYTIAAMQTIGRFHGMGYVMKTRNPDQVIDILDTIQETRFQPGDLFNTFINAVATRPVDWLRKKHYDKKFVNLMSDYLSDVFENVMINALKPVEPLAVLCHGDFTRNNVFFRKTERGLDAMLIDFAMLRYAQPAVDTSTFIYLNVSRNDRNERFNEIFKAYHDALVNYLRENGINDVKKYSYDKFISDYKRHAMFGYIIALFFLPITRGVASLDVESVVNRNIDKLTENSRRAGGDDFSEEIADILLDLRDQGFLDHILKK